MKKISVILLSLIFVSSLFFTCKKDKDDEEDDEDVVQTESILPARFAIDIPEAISSSTINKGSSKGNTELKGNDIYEHMRLFINVGESAAKFIQDIIGAISTNSINSAMTVSFTGEDGRTKDLVVVENASYEGSTWEFKMTISDQGSNGLQVFWNRSPIKGIAIVKPYHCNRNEKWDINALFRIDYNEAGTTYEREMIVAASNLTPDTANVNYISSMKMFVGKTGDVIYIYGNSNHPTAKIVDPNHAGGRNWAFVAKANDVLNIGVAKVGLPECAVNSTDSIFTTYSLINVLSEEIHAVYDSQYDTAQVDSVINLFLVNANAPGYFTSGGFHSCGATLPSVTGFTSDFANLSSLTPYKPKDVNDLIISFDN